MQLCDKMFVDQSEGDFSTVVENKVGSFRTISSTVDISSLDFVVAFSSIAALTGTGGQSNYIRCVGYWLDARISVYAIIALAWRWRKFYPHIRMPSR